MKNPKIYKNMGARLRRGILLYGPPGTGKTLLARATAGESKVNFIHCAASEFVEIYVGNITIFEMKKRIWSIESSQTICESTR